jgi:hypothetical protein
LANFCGRAEVGYGVGQGVMVAQAQEGREFLGVEFLHPGLDVVLENKVEEGLLLGLEVGVD